MRTINVTDSTAQPAVAESFDVYDVTITADVYEVTITPGLPVAAGYLLDFSDADNSMYLGWF